MAAYEATFPIFGWHLVKTFGTSKILTCLTTENLFPHSYVEGKNTTQTEAGMSKILEERPTCFPKISSEKKHILSKVELKNAFVTGVEFNTELHSRKINVPEHQ